MPFQLPLFGAYGAGKTTQSAGTVITRLIPPRRNAFTRLTQVAYTAGATAHTLTVMRPLNRTTTTAAVAAGASYVLPLTADPGDYPSGSRVTDNAIAANDYVVVELADGTFFVDTVASVSSLNVTMNGTLPTGGCASGAKVWFFGIITDTNPADALAHPQFTLPASTTTILGGQPGDAIAGFIGTIAHPSTFTDMDGKFQPIILHSGNATNAGVLESAHAVYSSK